IEWNGKPDHPLRCSLQGIGLFDGFYDDLVISNNLVSVTAYHGIAVNGVRGAKIVNNTVVHALGHTKAEPWIAVSPHKNGTPSTDVLVANNVAMRYMGSSNASNRVEFRSNSVIGTPGAVFESPSAFDYRPRAESGFIDTADKASAPPVDMLGKARPSGIAPDRGSYEIQVVTAPAPTTPEPTAPAPTKPQPTKPEPTKPKPTKPKPEISSGANAGTSGTTATGGTDTKVTKSARRFLRRAFFRVFGL
ncbi:MAG: choice-of-anchor Q domain-containing protein, partial [Paracoccaceae bacterium]